MSHPENSPNNESIEKGFYSINDLRKIKEDIRNYYGSKKLNTTRKTYNELAADISDFNKNNGSENIRITATTLCNIYTFDKAAKTYNDKLGTHVKLIPKNNSKIECIKRFFEHHNTDQSKYSIDITANILEGYYLSGELSKGLKESEDAYERFKEKYDSRIIKHAFRYNMRFRNWARIDEIYRECVSKNVSSSVKRVCNLAMFESKIRKAYAGYRNNTEKLFKKVNKARRYLNEIPKIERSHPQVLYWEGRWYLELWYATPKDDSNLTYALERLNASLSKKYSWWVHYYKCAVLKLLNREYIEESKRFQETILKLYNESYSQPSKTMYCFSSYVLLDDPDGLKNFIQKIKINEPNDFYSSSFHHIECLYRTNEERCKIYKDILESIL